MELRNMQLSVCCLLCAFLIADAYYVYPIYQENGAVKCVDKSSGREYNVGETWYVDEQCESMTCVNLRGRLYIRRTGCGVTAIPPDCLLLNKFGSYPDCCPHTFAEFKFLSGILAVNAQQFKTKLIENFNCSAVEKMSL